jgi:hypothetical protein
MAEKEYKTFSDFYPYYLREHSNRTSRILHYIGTSLFLSILFWSLITGRYTILIAGPFAGYGFAWVGHFFFEKNKPATFKYPFFSLASDFVMLFHFVTGQIETKLKEAHSESYS